MNLASYIDHTLLRPDSTDEEITRLCEEAVKFGFYSVCIPPYFVRKCKKLLAGSAVKICTVIGFPYGYSYTPAKVEEARRAMDEGVHEIDMVINLIALQHGDLNYLRNELTSVCTMVQLKGGIIKVILETGLLTAEQIETGCKLCADLNVDYVKTSTGVNGPGANEEVIRQLRKLLPRNIRIKASGGIKNREQAEKLIAAGADRIGSSASVQIVSK